MIHLKHSMRNTWSVAAIFFVLAYSGQCLGRRNPGIGSSESQRRAEGNQRRLSKEIQARG